MLQRANVWTSYEQEAEHYDDDGNYYAPMEVWLPLLIAQIEAKRNRGKPQLRILPYMRKEKWVVSLPPLLRQIPGRRRIKPHAHPMAQLAQGMKQVEDALKSGVSQEDCNRYLNDLKTKIDLYFKESDT